MLIKLTGGKVYDPANNINGQVRDICVSDGKVVAEVDAGARTIVAARVPIVK